MPNKKLESQYSEQEAARRRDEVAKVLLKTPPQPNWWPTNVRKKRVAKKRSATRPKAKS